nr:MAG TPA: hypothetical protein [Caudoviricetes sp.]DAS26912.1 MAG TPA: hypothetical protein [Caudoviricetes sp.]DAT05842.1 MAG TPA: hypothetical protein [Caudoviricetes sp.]
MRIRKLFSVPAYEISFQQNYLKKISLSRNFAIIDIIYAD